MLETASGWIADFLSHHGQASPVEARPAAGSPPPGVATAQPAAALHAARQQIRQHRSRLDAQSEDQLGHLLTLIGWARDAHAGTRGAAPTSGSQDHMIRDLLVILHATVQGIAFDLI